MFPPGLSAEELSRLSAPVFYRDSQHVFFLDPAVEETTFDKWEEYAVPVPVPQPRRWQPIPIVRQRPNWRTSNAPLEVVISPDATIRRVPKDDWLVNEKALFVNGDRAFGATGSLPAQKLMDLTTTDLGAVGVALRETSGSSLIGLPGEQSVEALHVVGPTGASVVTERLMGSIRGFSPPI